MALIRINKFIADSGNCSRRKADQYISEGKVTINGKPATMGISVDPEHDVVIVNHQVIASSHSGHEYWALYKPKGVISTAKDDENRKTVVEMVQTARRVYPVGRLDADSEGLIILTSDGDFANKLMHPKFEHLKSYTVWATPMKKNSPNWIKHQLETGFRIGGKTMRAHKVSNIVKDESGKFILELELITGYNRQIRKMCDKIDLKVEKLVRTGIAKLNLSDLKIKVGESKQIKLDEII